MGKSIPLSIGTPITILNLLFDQSLQIYSLVELIRLSSRIAYPAFSIQVFCHLESLRKPSSLLYLRMLTFMTF